jgi:hypothetical protein
VSGPSGVPKFPHDLVPDAKRHHGTLALDSHFFVLVTDKQRPLGTLRIAPQQQKTAKF